MDAAGWINLVSFVLLGSGGLGGLIAGFWRWKAHKRGAATGEADAWIQSAPGWDELADRYQKQLDVLQANLEREMKELQAQVRYLRQLRAIDIAYIDTLNNYIWERKPPPPPPRPVYPQDPSL